MGCVIKFNESAIPHTFECTGYKQKIIIELLVTYSNYSKSALAEVLDVSIAELEDVLEGKTFLAPKEADDLAQLFLIFFGSSFSGKFSMIRSFGREHCI
ncbi:MAG: hypothetical protein CMF38_01410 [Legionellaceae bacterium]|nr:hypothetical protein [Legionellaceae bacterium]HAF87536.1 hypothetical protein [Legionellales bacterium]